MARRREKKQTPVQSSSSPKQAPQQRSDVLRLQDAAGNRAVSNLLDTFSDVPKPHIIRTSAGLTATLYFAKNSAFLDPKNFQVLEQIAQELGFLFDPMITVDGHASTEGTQEQNYTLSQRRRQLVTALLTGQLKKPPTVTGDAFGETQPAISEEATSEQERKQLQAQNRRVEITILYNPRTTAEPQEPEADLSVPPPRLVSPPPMDPFDVKLPSPTKRPKVSIAGTLDENFDEVANNILNRLRVDKPFIRTILKKGARAAVEKGAEALLDEAIDEAGLSDKTGEAFKAGLKAGLKFEF